MYQYLRRHQHQRTATTPPPDSILVSYIFQTSLGSVCPQIGGIKVYSRPAAQTSASLSSAASLLDRGEVVFDVDLAWASGCDLDLRILSAGPLSLRAAVRDLCLAGTLRVVLRPLLRDYPLVGGVQVAFIVGIEEENNCCSKYIYALLSYFSLVSSPARFRPGRNRQCGGRARAGRDSQVKFPQPNYNYFRTR